MAEADNRHKQFTVDLDGLLSGKTAPGAAADADYKATVDFARKMASLRPEPSPEFKERLRKKLMARLVEQEMAAEKATGKRAGFAQFIANIWPRQVAWRVATVAVVLTLLVFGGYSVGRALYKPAGTPMVAATVPAATTPGATDAARSQEKASGVMGAAPPPQITLSIPPAPSTAAVEAQVEVAVSLDKASYAAGEPVTMTLVLTNKTAGDLVIDPFPPELNIVDSGGYVVRVVAAGGTSVTVGAGQQVQYIFVWDQLDGQMNRVPAGTYRVVASKVTTTGNNAFSFYMPQVSEIVITGP